jgi:hypothetical protein
MGAVIAAIGAHAAGETILVRLRHGEETIELEATLAARPSSGRG